MSYRADKQVIDTHTLTDTQTGAMTIPEGQNWPRIKIALQDLLEIWKKRHRIIMVPIGAVYMHQSPSCVVMENQWDD